MFDVNQLDFPRIDESKGKLRQGNPRNNVHTPI